jgi:hypothetical protein
MAINTNPTTSADIAELVPEIIEAAGYAYDESGVMPAIVNRRDTSGTPGTTVSFPVFEIVSEDDSVTESGEVTASVLDTPETVLTLARRAASIKLTGLARKASREDLSVHAGVLLGRARARAVDTRILSSFDLVSGDYQSAGSTDDALTWTHFNEALLKVKESEAAGPFFCVLAPQQAHELRGAISPVATGGAILAGSEGVANVWRLGQFMGQYLGVRIFESGRVQVGSDGVNDDLHLGVLYSQDVLLYASSDHENPIEIVREPLYDLDLYVLNYYDAAGVQTASDQENGLCVLYSKST